ncbi:MAG: SRPBCC family protein [Bacteroidota bacterium]
MPQNVTVEESIIINVPKESLWKVTALEFDKIGVWSAGVTNSDGYGTSEIGAVCRERHCTPSYKGFKQTTERIVDYRPENYSFTYQIVSGLPGMVKKATNTWLHVGIGDKTRISMQVSMQLQGFMGWVMKGPMQGKMKKILRENLEELKVYAETGKVHKRKKTLNQSLAEV